ncbi:MAG: hypothetical protein Q4G59_04550 [Planctomycetia bacterium]|nr:hypothetical protein [Planctomycetia bacterium]
MKEGLKFSHIGIPTKDRKPPFRLEGGKLFFNNFEDEPYAVEWLNFDEDSPMPALLQNMPHIAFEVESIAKAIEGEKVIVEPFQPGPGMTCAFIEYDGIAIELIEKS